MDMVKHERGKHPVKRRVGIRQLIGKALIKLDGKPRACCLLLGPGQRFRIWIEPHNGDFGMNALDQLNQSTRSAADVENAITGTKIRLLEECSRRGIGSEELHKRIVERQSPVAPGRGKIGSLNFLHGGLLSDKSVPYSAYDR